MNGIAALVPATLRSPIRTVKAVPGEDIPIGSRIIFACDAYHAMTSDRPYRAAMSHGEAIAELSANGGSQFDARVVEILIGQLYGQRQGAAAVSGSSPSP